MFQEMLSFSVRWHEQAFLSIILYLCQNAGSINNMLKICKNRTIETGTKLHLDHLNNFSREEVCKFEISSKTFM